VMGKPPDYGRMSQVTLRIWNLESDYQNLF
jgi:hypothetical protein